MKKILTVCSAGLCRSVALADVLKLHFEPVDVVPVGIDKNTTVLPLLFNWADHIIVMQEKYGLRVPEEYRGKVITCEVGPDVYGGSRNPVLIDMVWRWARKNASALQIAEHDKKL